MFRRFGILSLISLPLFAADAPNYRFEERLDRTFEYLKEQKMSKEQWDVMTLERNIDRYEIVPGDNLWDVSKTIFGSGFFWPKLWQLNGDITNPHTIEPGLQLNFIDMGVAAPPMLQTSGLENQKAPELAQLPEEEELALSEDEVLELNWIEPEIPEGKKSPKVLNRIPPSFFDWRSSMNKLNKLGAATVKEAKILQMKKYDLEFVFMENQIEGEGKILETEQGYSTTASAYDMVFVEIKTAGVGDVYLALKEMEPIKNEDGDILGYPNHLQAVLKVVETIDEEKKLHKALVLKSYSLLDPGAKLLAREMFSSTWGVEGRYLDLKAKIVGGRYHKNRDAMGLGSVVFLDKGTKDGVEEGALLNILKNYDLRGVRNFGKDAPSIGRLKVIYADNSIATGVIVESRESIQVGDFTGNPVSLQIRQ